MTVRTAEVPVDSKDDLHLRPMQALVEAASAFTARLTVARGRKQADAKSLLDVMMLASEKGPLRIEADGADADEAVKALTALMTGPLNKG